MQDPLTVNTSTTDYVYFNALIILLSQKHRTLVLWILKSKRQNYRNYWTSNDHHCEVKYDHGFILSGTVSCKFQESKKNTSGLFFNHTCICQRLPSMPAYIFFIIGPTNVAFWPPSMVCISVRSYTQSIASNSEDHYTLGRYLFTTYGYFQLHVTINASYISYFDIVSDHDNVDW